MHVWTIASLSVHRYWKISRPVTSRFKDTASRARLAILIMLILALLFRLPLFLVELQLKWKPMFRIGRRVETTELLSPYRIVYHSFLDPVLSNFLPFIWMSAFSILTLCEIIKSRHFSYMKFSFDGNDGSFKKIYSKNSSQPLTFLRRRADCIRQRQEFRATISIVLIIVLYLLFHSLQLYNVVRKWQLLLQKKCPTRTDYIQSHIANVLSLLSCSVNAFVFIAFTNRIRSYVQMLIRKTSRSLSNSSDPPHSPKTITSVDPMLVGQNSSDSAFL
uniref:G-protein coupled receptors family 1 profile domain-containing protein n=1 Tax=Acrobeloides nanus TaxID=290746 RepID=A0A914C2V7_9BILA